MIRAVTIIVLWEVSRFYLRRVGLWILRAHWAKGH